MTAPFFGEPMKTSETIKLKIFCDESGSSDGWLYVGMLIVPEHLEELLLSDLLQKRCAHPDRNKVWGQCNPPCKYHSKNDTEFHYGEVEKSKDKFYLGQRWLEYLLNDREQVFFYVFGLDMKKLDKTQFGLSDQYNSIYNRFFRSAVLKSVKSYFYKHQSIVIDSIYHDNNPSLETDTLFPWHSLFRIDRLDDKVNVVANSIVFLDSDHRKSQNSYSHFIQFVDLLLGCVNNCLDHGSVNPDKVALAEKSLPLIRRLIENPNNKNSSYNYVGRQKIEFFPKHELRDLDSDSLEYRYKKMDSFYHKRRLQIMNKHQLSLYE